MKLLALLIMSAMFVSCASTDRQVASQGQEEQQQFERSGFGPGYQH
jgi:hypothetical protein